MEQHSGPLTIGVRRAAALLGLAPSSVSARMDRGELAYAVERMQRKPLLGDVLRLAARGPVHRTSRGRRRG